MTERFSTAFMGKTSPEEERLQHYRQIEIEKLNATPYAQMAAQFPQHAAHIKLMIAEIKPLLALVAQLSVDVAQTFTHETPKEELLYTETLERTTLRLMRECSPNDMVRIIPAIVLAPLGRVGVTPRDPAVFANLQVWQPLVFVADGTLNFSGSFPQELFAVMDELTSLFMQYNQLKSNFVPSPSVGRPMPAELSRHLAIADASVSPGFGGIVPNLDLPEPMSPPSPSPYIMQSPTVARLTPDSSLESSPLADPSTPSAPSSSAPSTSAPPSTSSSAPSTSAPSTSAPSSSAPSTSSSSSSAPSASPPPPSPPTVQHVSFAIIIHGQTLSGGRFEYPIEQELSQVSYAVGQYQCPATVRKFLLDSPGSGAIASDPRFSEHAAVIRGVHASNERCFSECDAQGNCWVALQPMLFSFERPTEEPAVIQAEGGIWAFYFMSDGTIQRNHSMGYNEMVQSHKLDRSYGTYMHLFGILREKLRAIRQTHTTPFSVNTLFHCCRTGPQAALLPHLLKVVERHDIVQSAAITSRLYQYPTGAVVRTAVEIHQISPTAVVEMFAIQIASQPDYMVPLGHRGPGGLHFFRQGCFYNMLVYLGIINHVQGDIMTSIQNRGITSKMFLNFMNQIRPIDGTHAYMVEHLPIAHMQPSIQFDAANGLSKLLYTMLALSHHYQLTGFPLAHAIIVKLYFPEGSEQGHWVTFTLDRSDIRAAAAAGARQWSQDPTDAISLIGATPWRYVDPQALSIQRNPMTQLSETVPMAFQRLNSLDEMCTLLNSFVGRYGALDLFYIALPEGAPQSFLRFDPAQLMGSTYTPPSGGKPRTMKNKKNKINKTKTKTKTKNKKTNTKRKCKCTQNKKKIQ